MSYANEIKYAMRMWQKLKYADEEQYFGEVSIAGMPQHPP